MSKQLLWAVVGAVVGIACVGIIGLWTGILRLDGQDATVASAPRQEGGPDAGPTTPKPNRAVQPESQMAPDQSTDAKSIDWVEPSPVPPDVSIGFAKVTEHYTKTTMTQLDEGLYAELWCRLESGGALAKVKDLLISFGVGATQILAADSGIATELKDFTGEKGDAFCIAFKTSSLETPRVEHLFLGDDLQMTQRAYKGSKKIDEKSEPCHGRVCLLGTRGAGADAVTTCIELPTTAVDDKPRSFVVGIGQYGDLIDKDYDPGSGRWPVAKVACTERKF